MYIYIYVSLLVARRAGGMAHGFNRVGGMSGGIRSGRGMKLSRGGILRFTVYSCVINSVRKLSW